MKRHYNVTLRDIKSQTPAKKSNLDALKMIKEKSNVAGCDFSKENQLMSRKIPQEKILGDDKEPASGTYHAHEAPTAFPGSLQINVTGASGYSPVCEPGYGSYRMHLFKVLVKSNTRQRM